MQGRCKYCQGELSVDARIDRPELSIRKCPHCKKPFFIVANDQGHPLRFIFENSGKGCYERACTRCGNIFRTNSLRDIPVCSDCKTGEFRIDTASNQHSNEWMVRKIDGRIFGPTNLDELQQLASKGIFSRHDQIRGPGQTWVAINSLEGFKNFFSDLTPSPISNVGKLVVPTSEQQKPRRRLPRISTVLGHLWHLTLLLALLLVAVYLAWKAPWKHWLIKSAPPVASSSSQNAWMTTRNELIAEARPFLYSTSSLSVIEALNQDRFMAYRQVALSLKKNIASFPEASDQLTTAQLQQLGELGEISAYLSILQQDNNLERRAFTLASLAMQQSASKLSGMRAQAAMLLKSGNPQEVVRLLTGQAQDSRLQLYLGLAQLELHQFNEALERLQKVVGEHPEIVEAQHALVETYEKLGQWWLAKQIINRLLLTESDHPQTQFQMAWQNEVSRQWDRAIKGYQQVLRLEPTDVQARLRLAALLYRYKKDFAEATRNLDEVRQRYLKYCRDRQRLELYFHLGNLNFLKKDYQHSVEFYTESLKAAPYFVPAMIQLSLASQQLQQPLQGLNELKQAYGTANQDLRVLVVLLRSMQKNSDEAEVARLLTEVVNQYPESLLLLLEQLRVYWNRQQFEEAERLLRRGLMEIHPNNEALLFQNVNEVILVDLWSDYHSLLQQFQKTQPKSAAVLTTLGIVESFMGARRQAEADLNKAIELEADFLPATTMLADHWLRFQQPKKAMALLNRNWSDSEGDRVPRLLLTEAWLALGQTQKAEMSMPPLNQQLNNWSCRQATAQMRLMQTQDYRRPDKNRQLFFNCAAEPIYYHPAIQLIFDSKLSEPY